MTQLEGVAKYAWQIQPDAVLDQANPVSTNTYSVLVATEDVRILSISASVTWTVQPSPLEAIVMVDGNTILHQQADPVSTTEYTPLITPATPENLQLMDTTGVISSRAFLYEGQSVAVQARTTGGTTSNLSCRVKWAKLLPT